MAMVSISHTEKSHSIILLYSQGDLMALWTNEALEKKSLEYKMCLGELYGQVELSTTYSTI